jgi:predicted nucleic acid-binding protein
VEQSKYLIDTNSVIDFLGNKFPASGMDFIRMVVDEIPIVSVITKIEVLGFNTTDANQTLLVNFMNDATILELTNNVVGICIKLRKNYRIKLPDAIIAATAIAYDLVLITRNISDFNKIKEVKTINPYSLGNLS